ncbi:hypothetical protein ACLMJI_08080, partial [Bifidobacterium longum]
MLCVSQSYDCGSLPPSPPRGAPPPAPVVARHFVKMVHNGIEYADMQV